jgi:hypothetical protein
MEETFIETKEKKNQDARKAAEWISAIIESCRHPFHLAGAKKLVVYFKEMYGEKYGTVKLHEELLMKLIDQMDKVEII